MPEFTLYFTLGCHLCELAEAELLPWVAAGNIEVILQDIAEDILLVELYGVRIPVLQNCATLAELNWPFGHDELRLFLPA